MQTFFFIFFYLQKIAPRIAKKADTPTNTHPPPDRPPQRKYGSHRDTTHGCSSWTAHPGAHIFPVPGPALFGHTRYGSSIPAALWLILDYSSCPVDPSSRWIPHPMGHPSLDILDQDRDTSSRSSCPVDPGPSRDIVAGGTSWTIPMDPDGSSSHGPGIPGRWVTVADGSWTVGDGG